MANQLSQWQPLTLCSVCARKQDGPLRPAAMPDDGQGGAKYFERSNLKGTGGDDPAGWFCTNGLILLAAPSSYQLTGDY